MATLDRITAMAQSSDFSEDIMAENAAPDQLSGKSAAGWLTEVRHAEREGELFLAYDLARQGLQDFPEDLALKHRAVLCLASTGARGRAAEEFLRLGLAMDLQSRPRDVPASLAFDLANLQARLLKDEAIATVGPERGQRLATASHAYEAVYKRMEAAGDPNSYYPGINCATLRLLADDRTGAEALAQQIRDRLAGWPTEKGYYEIATDLEAALIVGDFDGATAAARTIVARIRGGSEHDYRALASTIRQLRLVVAAKQIDPDTLADLLPPRVIHYLGHIISAAGGRGRFPATEEETVRQEIGECFATRDIGFAYGSLAAGADILFAEIGRAHV